MKNLNIIYKHRHLYDAQTQKRVHLQDGASFALQGNNASFLDEDLLNAPIPTEDIRSSEEMKASVLRLKHLKSYAKLLDAGHKLQFRIGISKTKTDREQTQYYFEVELLEDLYMVRKKTWRKDTLPMLCGCHCVVYANPGENVQFFEPIYADSLNNAYGKTIMMYFANQRSAGCNVFNDFTEVRKSMIPLDAYRKREINRMIEVEG